MEEMIEARVSPAHVWAAWEKGMEQGKGGKIRYKIIDLKKGESFSILWKTLFVRLIFSHSVKPTLYGSNISYKVQIKGLFAWPVRFFLGKKIQTNLRAVLKAVVRELESTDTFS
jgi:hypothetical protein